MANYSSSIDLAQFSDQDLRDSWLAKALLLRNLFTALRLRGQLGRILLRRATAEKDSVAPHAWMEVLHATWVLTENLLAAFELLAEPDIFDSRMDARRKAAWSRLRDRGARKRGKFVKKAWGYPLIATPALDELYVARGLTIERGRAATLSMVTRSAAHLERVQQELQAFHHRYEAPCTAFKHGRALFSLAVNVRRGSNREVTGMNLKRDESTLSVISMNGNHARLTELRFDGHITAEIKSTLSTVRSLVERQWQRYSHVVPVLERFLANRGCGPETILGLLHVLDIFVEPETPDERTLFRWRAG